MAHIAFLLPLALLAGLAQAQHHHMHMDASGMVMNANSSELPRGCAEISADVAVTVRAGREYARDIPGHIFGMSAHELRVPPCARVTVEFHNDDSVRHQWMVHGLPTYLYPQGMFHMEASAGASQTGSFIVPADDRTYLIHCDMAQHMEKGMKGQLVVGAGSGNLWSVPDSGRAYTRAYYLPDTIIWWIAASLAAGFGLVLIRDRFG